MQKIVDMINYEIEYVLRPMSAPARWVDRVKEIKLGKKKENTFSTKEKK